MNDSITSHAETGTLVHRRSKKRTTKKNMNHDDFRRYIVNKELNELWTNGVPDANKIKRRMEQLAHEYVNKRFQVITTGRFRFQREIILRKQAEREFYSAMWHLEDLLYAVPVLPLQAESTTTIVPYQPAKRRRGRPATGVKPRDRRVNKDDDSY